MIFNVLKMPDEKRQNAKIIRNGFRMLWSVKNSGV